MSSAATLFCFGYGYSAAALGARLRRQGVRVSGTRRGEAEVAALGAAGIDAHRFDGAAPLDAAGRAALAAASHVLVSVPPEGARGDPVLHHHRADLAAGGRAGVTWLGYLSTTGVYGDHGGAWVDEATPPSPAGARGRARLAAEEAWLALGREAGLAVQLFRLAGIYGPGRSALDAVRAGTARRIEKPGQVFSRIHVEDIASVLEASMGCPRGGGVYNVCDDEPAPPGEVIGFACALLGVDPPPVVAYADVAPTLSDMARSFYAENKRVSNALIKRELGVRLAYPDYRSGLRAIFQVERGA
jgi:nucleoside-diphosphate-sugar epimerase